MALATRTVLDLRSPLDKYVSQTLLLAASWHRYCPNDTQLEVLTIGNDDQLLFGFLDEIGALHAGIPPGQNDHFSKNSNKISATYPDPQGRRVLLLDNDTCFLGSICELNRLPETAIAASVAGNSRVSDAQWELIRGSVGLPLLRRRFIPLNGQPAEEGGDDDIPERYLYLNSGAVLFPVGHDHRPLWSAHQTRIHEFFRDHPLRSKAVTSSDQAALASSIAAHGEFEWLPLRFNYRRGCFRIGAETPDRIGIAHFTGDVPGSSELGLAQRMHAYWQKFMLPKIEGVPSSVAAAEKLRRKEIALEVLSTVLAIIRDYDLEARLDAYRRSRQRHLVA
jgi:hypothetical protein